MPPPDRGADAEAAIRALIGAYAERLDAGDLDGVAALFERGVFCSARGGSVRTGTAEVRRMYDPVILYGDGTPRTKHVLGNTLVDVDDAAGSASASCTFTVLQGVADAPLRAVLAGRYVDRFTRADGAWWFAERVVHAELQGDLSRHMGRAVTDAPALLADLARARDHNDGAPIVVGIAGAVASGKSTLAEAVAQRAIAGGTPADVVSTDGFLFPNAELVERGLLARKGFPESYDVDALCGFVDAVHSGTSEVSVPRYSHLTYDVVPGEPLSPAIDAFIVIEGVNALGALGDRLDLAVYLHAEEEDLERWYVERFLELCDEATNDANSFYRQFVGMTPSEIDALARQVWRSVNLVNLRECISPTRAVADCVVVKGPDHAVTKVEIREHRGANDQGIRS